MACGHAPGVLDLSTSRGHPDAAGILDIVDNEYSEAEKIGQAFVTLVLTARALGHTDIRDTAREYLLPHASADRSPEQLFVLAAVAGPAAGGMRPDELLPDDDDDAVIEALQSGPPPLP